MSVRAPVITDQVAINTIIGFAVCLAISLATIYALIIRFLATLDQIPASVVFMRRMVMTRFCLRRTHETSSQGPSEQHVRHKHGISKHSRIVGQERMILLLLVAIFHAVESVSNFFYINSLWRTGNTNFPFHFALRAITVLPAGPLMTIATARRISIIVVTHPTWRTWFMRIIRAVCLIVMLVLQTVHLLSVMVRVGAPPHVWLASVTVPPWTSAFIMSLPIVSIGSSLWALKVAFMDHHHAASSSSATSGGSVSSSTSLPPLPEYQAASEGGKILLNGTGGIDAPPSAITSLHSRANSYHGPPRSQSSSGITSASSFSPPPLDQPRSDFASPQLQSLTNPRVSANPEPSSLQYSLNVSFKLLSVLMTVWYILHSLLIIFQEPLAPIVPMRVSVLTTNVAALAVATEAGFEWLLKTSRLRRKRKKREEQIKKASSKIASDKGKVARSSSKLELGATGATIVGTTVVGGENTGSTRG